MHKPRIVLLVIALLFFAPLLLAILMRSSWWDFQPSQLSNRGILIDPPVRFEAGDLSADEEPTPVSGAWTVLFLHAGRCDDPCLARLAELRQVHLASGRHRGRIRLWLLGSRAADAAAVSRMRQVYPEFKLVDDIAGRAARALQQASRSQADLEIDAWHGQLFVLDPGGNIILGYPPDSDPLDLSEDLDRLLTWSGRE